MNAEELASCMKRLIGYYPGEWDEARRAVWAVELLPMSMDQAVPAIEAMGRAERWPTVAALMEHAGRGPRQAGVIQRDGCTFVPGTGWLGGVHPDAGTAPALPPGSNADAVPAGISGARAHAAHAARPLAAVSDPEVVRQVDEAAARLRQSPQDRPDAPGGSDPTGAGPAGAPDPLSGPLTADDEASARAAGRAIGEAILADLDAGGDGDVDAVLEIRSPDPEITGGGWGDEVHHPAGASVADFEAGMTELRRQLKDGWS
jgi:hypothetical protein